MRTPLPLLLLCFGCTLGPGDPFATLSARVQASLSQPAGRSAADGFQRLSTDYQVRFTALRLDATALELVDLGSGATLAFDPARPPPGYGLCHNGHCHRDDGALVDYAVISAEVTGGGGPSAVASLPAQELDVLAGTDLPLSCGEGCTLPSATVGQVRLRIRGLVAEGVVRDGRAQPRIPEQPFRLQALLPEGSELSTPTAIEVSRHASPRVDVALTVQLGASLLDGLPLEQLPTVGGALDAYPPSMPDLQKQVRVNLAETGLDVVVER
ncbi:MAG: hypothetical protein FJ086_04435 [Deltaproteobacteria bacterium]|nr:hypothetical protein [Deltaproteobacteria bacterium]